MSKVQVNSHGVNAKIKAHILPEEKMRRIGFTDYAKDTWYFCRTVIKEKSKRKYGGIDFEVSFSVSIPKDGSDIRIDVLDEAFYQPFQYQAILEENANHRTSLIIKEKVEEYMKYLQYNHVLEGHVYGEYI